MSRSYSPSENSVIASVAESAEAFACKLVEIFFHSFDEMPTVLLASILPSGAQRLIFAFPPFPVVRAKKEKSYFPPSFITIPSNPALLSSAPAFTFSDA